METATKHHSVSRVSSRCLLSYSGLDLGAVGVCLLLDVHSSELNVGIM